MILGEGPVRLWGLSSRERLRRQLARAGVLRVGDPARPPSGPDTVVLLRADHLYDDRVVTALVRTPGVLLRGGPDPLAPAVAAHVPAGQAAEVGRALEAGGAGAVPAAGLRPVSPETLAPSYREDLRKSEPPFVVPIAAGQQRALEDRLFAGSYKSVTDFITKWVWPRPARRVTRLCAAAGITPNQVTAAGTLLAAVAGLLFAGGHFAWGLVLGWVMTFLDTVDGKLARVTVTSSRSGHYLDKLTDLIHPPLWYVAWGLGQPGREPGPGAAALTTTLGVIVVGYVVGRLAEGAFRLWLADFSLFCWRPVDSWFRLVTARRNPNLVLLTAGALAGRPDLGLLAVAAWTALSSAILIGRLGMAAWARASGGPLRSWLAEPAAGPGPSSRADRFFAAPVSQR